MADNQKYTAEEKRKTCRARQGARGPQEGAPEAEEGPDKTSRARTKGPRYERRPQDLRRVAYSNAPETSAGPPYEAFLKYLPHDCTEQQVTRFFAGCGPLEKAPRILKDRATGRVIRGFVTFAEEQGLQNALQKDGHKLGGRNVR